ncbi:hypothetical protein G6L30_17120 [Agrobacterium rhizogenes]|nr:hypothetical protein [Rhizobium rhizogenes]
MDTPRENDIYRWYWKDSVDRSYHCMSHIAVFCGGALRDTFWYDWKSRGGLDLEAVDLTLLGNIDECDVISRWQKAYYEPSDVIDTAHSNNSGAPIYLKRTAVKSQSVMLEYAEEAAKDALRRRDSAQCDMETWAEKIDRIKQGDLEVYL